MYHQIQYHKSLDLTKARQLYEGLGLSFHLKARPHGVDPALPPSMSDYLDTQVGWNVKASDGGDQSKVSSPIICGN